MRTARCPTRQYLQELNEAYHHFFFHYTASPLLVVETSQFAPRRARTCSTTLSARSNDGQGHPLLRTHARVMERRRPAARVSLTVARQPSKLALHGLVQEEPQADGVDAREGQQDSRGPVGEVPGLRPGDLQQGPRGQPPRLPEMRLPLPDWRDRPPAHAVRRRPVRRVRRRPRLDRSPRVRGHQAVRGSAATARAGHRREGRGHLRDRRRSTGSRASSRPWSTPSSAAAWAWSSGRRSPAAIERAIERRAAGGDRLLLRRRAHDGRRALADADGEDQRGARAARPRAPALSSRCSPTRRPAA